MAMPSSTHTPGLAGARGKPATGLPESGGTC